MAATLAPAPFGAKEIFRYARIRQPRIIDIVLRARGSSRLKAIVDRPAAERAAWARDQIKSDQAVRSEADLRFDYFAHLSIKALPVDRLPSRKVVRDPIAFASAGFDSDKNRRADLDNCLASLFAFKILRDEENAAAVGRLLRFVELFPELHRVDEERDYPNAVLTKIEIKAPAPPPPHDRQPGVARELAADVGKLARHVETLWAARNKRLATQRAELNERYRQIMTMPLVDAGTAKTSTAKGKRAKTSARTSSLLSARIKERRDNLVALRADYRTSTNALTLGAVLDMPPKQLSGNATAAAKLVVVQRETKALLEKHGIEAEAFVEVYQQVVAKADALGVKASTAADTDCYAENPRLMFGDTVRVLGHADLVRVDETFVEYSVGEISYVENILPGEIKKREVKSTKYFEEVTETTIEETSDTSSESSVTTKQDLGSQIATELAAHMNSESSVSASGSGGGTIGVVDFQGAGQAAASLNVGVDANLTTENTSNFSQEIISKAIEKTKSSSIERRLTRSYSLHETLHSHSVDNTLGDDIKARNGIYCFLDKHVCLTETVYGKRLFVMANLRLPGRNLLCEREQRLQLGLSELGQRPQFDITVDQIQPDTYKTLVGQFKASNVSPPPPPIQTIAKTYKTDNTNANAEKQGIDPKKVADALTPFFEQYKRFLITDNIRLPDGYEVREVTATINHGRNGISVPAHLPLKFVGAALGAGFTLASSASLANYASFVTVPLALYQFEYGISPLLHYNTDSSNVSLCLGNETQDSPYFFFEPEFLMDEILNAFGSFLQNAPDLLATIEISAGELLTQLKNKAAEVPDKVRDVVQDVINKLIENVKNALSNVSIRGSIRQGFRATFNDLSASLVDAQKLIDLGTGLGDMFEPLKAFITGVINLLREGMQNALIDLFAFVASLSENSQVLPFGNVAGIRGELPLSVNAVAIHPGITINVVASLSRSDEALDKWRLETFDALYQAYLQQLADYETKAMMLSKVDRVARSPATLRREEVIAMKELVLHALNNLHGPADSEYSFDRINFFENALDWGNMSFRLFNYGPNVSELEKEKRGVFGGIDDRRRAFLKAGWAQVLIPAQADLRLEQKVGQYFVDGTFDLESGFGIDELTALYQELINDRARIANGPTPQPIGHEVLPTDFIYISEELPVNDRSPCGLPIA
ncbi:MAG: hypothetical protein Q8M19_09700 [Reyranella sp.]|nr:hypothetical protein [Reyranella sp.]